MCAQSNEPMTLWGTDENDYLAGGEGADRIESFAGGDVVIGYGGADTIVTGYGGDVIFADSTCNDQIVEFWSGNGIWGRINGKNILPRPDDKDERGVTVVVTDPETGDVLDEVTFDTWESKEDRDAVINYLSNLDPDAVNIAVLTGDDARLQHSSGGSYAWTKDFYITMERFGAQDIRSVGYRDSYIFVRTSDGVVQFEDSEIIQDFEGRHASLYTAVRYPLTGEAEPVDTSGDDWINSGPGDDTVYGDGGNDTIFGEVGNDRLQGGDGDDVVFGGDGHDFLLGEKGSDLLIGGAGNDGLLGGDGNDGVGGGDGDDWLEGGNGDDFLDAGPGNDQVFGNEGADELTGGDGSDEFSGHLADLDGDVITDFSEYDLVRVLDYRFTNIAIDRSDAQTTLNFDVDNDGVIDSFMTLIGTFDGEFRLNTSDPGSIAYTEIRFVPISEDVISVDARGTPALSEFPELQIFLDGVFQGSRTVTSGSQTYDFIAADVGNASTLEVRFANDAYRPDQGMDRNLFVDKVVVEGNELDIASSIYVRDNLPSLQGQNELYWQGQLYFDLDDALLS